MLTAHTPARKLSTLSESLLRHLDCYALAATAAGVGLLALTAPAEAKIVYTKIHQAIGPNGIYDLDLNHDGTVDFLIQRSTYCHSSSCAGFQKSLFAQGALGNGVMGVVGSRWPYASALKSGAEIGPRQRVGITGELLIVAKDQDFSTIYTWGQWVNVKNRYLGLKFKIKGEFHYGWARLNAATGGGKITTALTGYAYETVANRPLRAGQTQEISANQDAGATSGTAPDATLGALARGTQNAVSRRRP